MKCEQIHTLMMDYLYDELLKEDLEEFDSHLARCNECREEVESLKTTSGILQKWGDVEPDIRLIVVKDKSSSFERFKEIFKRRLFKPRRLVFGFACAFSVIFIFLALANTEISINNGNFNMRLSFFNRPEGKVNTDIINSSQLLKELLRENLQLTTSLIAQSEAKQRQELAYMLTSFKKDIDQQRNQDMNLIGYGLNDFQKNTYQQIRKIDNTLNKLIRPADIKY